MAKHLIVFGSVDINIFALCNHPYIFTNFRSSDFDLKFGCENFRSWESQKQSSVYDLKYDWENKRLLNGKRHNFPSLFIQIFMMNDIVNFNGPVNKADVLQMVENDFTINIPRDALDEGQMLPYLRSISRYIDRQPITKLHSSSLKFDEDDLNFNVIADVTTKKFHGFKNTPVSELEFIESKEQVIQEYIWNQLRKEEEEKGGIGTVQNFFEGSYRSKKFQYMENMEYPERIFNLNKYGCKWNLREECNLPNGISGISSPWFYVGSKYSLFPLHLEDNNLRSLNIHLGGAPKVWFGFHFDDISTVEQILQQFEPAQACMYYHRHKNYFINPAIFSKIRETVPVYSVIQNPGDIILTNSFHQGINMGVNYNLAINFMLSSKDFKMANNGKFCAQDCKYNVKRSILKEVRLGYGLTCDICSKKFTSTRGLKKHYPNVHFQDFPETAKNRTCGLCGESFKKIEVHLKKKHKNDLPIEMCGLCRQTFRDQTEVRKHWTREHPKNNRTCQFCEETFDKMKDAQYHHCERDVD